MLDRTTLGLGVQSFWPLLLVPLAAGLAWFGYRTTTPPLGARERALFVTLRTLAFWALLVVLASPVLDLVRNEPLRAHIAVLVDESASMSTREPATASGSSRLGKAREAVRTLWEALKGEDVTVEVIPFDAEAQPSLSAPDYLAGERDAIGAGTDLIGVLRAATERLSGDNLRALVLVSDGRPTRGGLDPGALAALGRPVYALGLGDTLPARDLAIDRCDYAPIAYVESETSIRVRVENSGFRGRTTPLRLLDGDRELHRRELHFEQEHGLAELELPLQLAEPGAKRLRLVLEPLDGEVTERNNVREIRIEVLKNRMRVLFVAALPDWDVAFLARALADDPHVDLTLVHQNQSHNWIRSLDAAPFNLPLGVESLLGYELFVLGSPGAQPRRAFWEGIVQAVERGRGMLVLAGRESIYTAPGVFQVLAPALPVERARPQAVQYRVQGVRLSPQGRLHPVTSPFAAASDARASLVGVPPLLGLHAELAPKPAALTLLVSDAAQAEPILTVSRYGSGHVAALSGFPIWRWGFTETEHLRRAHGEFVSNLVRWLTQPLDVKRVRIAVSKPVYEGGEPVEFVAQVLDPQFEPLEDAELALEVRGSGGGTAGTLLLERRAGKPGEYAGTLPGLGPGEYSAEAVAARAATEVGRDTTQFTVETYSAEFANTSQDASFLREIAARTGGRYAGPEAAAEIAGELPRSPQPVLLHSEIEVWDTFPLFLCFIALLATEWLLRRRRGLL